MTSLGYTCSFISKKFRDYVGEAGMEAPQSINAISLSHALRVTKGDLLDQRYHRQDNPTLVPKHESAVPGSPDVLELLTPIAPGF